MYTFTTHKKRRLDTKDDRKKETNSIQNWLYERPGFEKSEDWKFGFQPRKIPKYTYQRQGLHPSMADYCRFCRIGGR